ncbi:glycosyltransferase family protein [Rufibacter tibetensis]|uniref:Glycosyl transferase n=1 Tax=Rufibacter tibetensis TaxID=512763 RepID=A0A0P0CX16_9BACT|nr:glycosyltransferase family protein [Rufibacter tibetensis]ALI99163.1 glycosyl transferase [Rufibacter tibetensis]
MKVLYAIQGTGNGHLARALEIVPILKRKCQLDILVSGCQADLVLPFKVKYKCHGLSFVFGKKGGVDFVKTFSQLETRAFYDQARKLPVEEYDLVISDFEPISAWACYFKEKPCLALSHQSAVMDPAAPHPIKEDRLGKLILQNYAPATAHYGFHFQRFSPTTFTPVIRSQVREIQPTNQGHYTVYLPAYADELLLKKLSKFPDVNWEVFSKHNQTPLRQGNIEIKPINNEAFIQSMASSTGVLCGAGFETPAEALYLQKKLLVVPMKRQYEQHCNATALASMGVPVVKSLKSRNLPIIEEWLRYGEAIPVEYPDETEQILDLILTAHYQEKEMKKAKVPFRQKWRNVAFQSFRAFFV